MQEQRLSALSNVVGVLLRKMDFEQSAKIHSHRNDAPAHLERRGQSLTTRGKQQGLETLLRPDTSPWNQGCPKQPPAPRSPPGAQQHPALPRCAPATDTKHFSSAYEFFNSQNYFLSLALSFTTVESTTRLAGLRFSFLRIFHFPHL